jgi:CRISPR/Cas system Type II protein with McrA/HNH and RuvC-like nuclease domain
MTKTTVSTAGGAVPKIDRAALMTRAWAIFRQEYKFPQIKFKDIGRKCFAWALRQAWVEAREATRLALMTPAAKAARIDTLQSLIAYANYIDCGPQWTATVRAHREEIRQLQAA